MSLSSRLEKLEAMVRNDATGATLAFVFYRVFDPNPERGSPIRVPELDEASVIGTEFQNLTPKRGEAERDFVRRVYAIKAGGKLTEDMTEDELAAAYARADVMLAQDEEMDRRQNGGPA